ncbi:MAG: dephospho-CoA kinase [Termitinemataceae bacterium]|nr:MAG: dephospho-CoA kinase [Termitinemataceae bacterium]
MSAKVIGLTGLYCAGKNYAADIFKQKGFEVLDVDKLGHEAIEKEKSAIARNFGKDILTESGTVNRRELGKKVFGNTEKLLLLESIVHPAANQLTDEWLELNKNKNCLIHAALLHKSSALKKVKAVIIVRAPFIVRLLRAKKRDCLSWKEIFYRFKSQKFNLNILSGSADVYYMNNGVKKTPPLRNRQNIEKQIDMILRKLD